MEETTKLLLPPSPKKETIVLKKPAQSINEHQLRFLKAHYVSVTEPPPVPLLMQMKQINNQSGTTLIKKPSVEQLELEARQITNDHSDARNNILKGILLASAQQRNAATPGIEGSSIRLLAKAQNNLHRPSTIIQQPGAFHISPRWAQEIRSDHFRPCIKPDHTTQPSLRQTLNGPLIMTDNDQFQGRRIVFQEDLAQFDIRSSTRISDNRRTSSMGMRASRCFNGSSTNKNA